MKAVLLLALMTLFAPPARGEAVESALLERVGFDRLEALSDEFDLPDARALFARVMSGGLGDMGDWPGRLLHSVARRVRKGLVQVFALLSAPVIVALLIRMALGRRDDPLTLLCRLASASGLMNLCAAALIEARGAVAAAGRMAGVVSPVLATALTLTGSTSTAALMTPLTALCAGAIETVLMNVALPACALSAAVAVTGGLSERFRLDRLFELLKRVSTWLVGLSLAGFAALMAAQGRVAAAQDHGATRAAGQALLGLIPIVGGALSGSADALIDSAFAVRSAVGVTGALLAVAACAGPALRLLALSLSVRLAAALIEPVADPCVTRIAARFGDVLNTLLAICAGSYALVALLAGASLSWS